MAPWSLLGTGLLSSFRRSDGLKEEGPQAVFVPVHHLMASWATTVATRLPIGCRSHPRIWCRRFFCISVGLLKEGGEFIIPTPPPPPPPPHRSPPNTHPDDVQRVAMKKEVQPEGSERSPLTDSPSWIKIEAWGLFPDICPDSVRTSVVSPSEDQMWTRPKAGGLPGSSSEVTTRRSLKEVAEVVEAQGQG